MPEAGSLAFPDISVNREVLSKPEGMEDSVHLKKEPPKLIRTAFRATLFKSLSLSSIVFFPK